MRLESPQYRWDKLPGIISNTRARLNKIGVNGLPGVCAKRRIYGQRSVRSDGRNTMLKVMDELLYNASIAHEFKVTITQATIAERTGLSRSQVSDAVSEWEESAYLDCTRRKKTSDDGDIKSICIIHINTKLLKDTGTTKKTIKHQLEWHKNENAKKLSKKAVKNSHRKTRKAQEDILILGVKAKKENAKKKQADISTTTFAKKITIRAQSKKKQININRVLADAAAQGLSADDLKLLRQELYDQLS